MSSIIQTIFREFKFQHLSQAFNWLSKKLRRDSVPSLSPFSSSSPIERQLSQFIFTKFHSFQEIDTRESIKLLIQLFNIDQFSLKLEEKRDEWREKRIEKSFPMKFSALDTNNKKGSNGEGKKKDENSL